VSTLLLTNDRLTCGQLRSLNDYVLCTLIGTKRVPHGRENQVQEVVANDGKARALHDDVKAALHRNESNFIRMLCTLGGVDLVLKCVSRDLLDLGNLLIEVVHGECSSSDEVSGKESRMCWMGRCCEQKMRRY
jgi:hypothetical protein